MVIVVISVIGFIVVIINTVKSKVVVVVNRLVVSVGIIRIVTILVLLLLSDPRLL